MQLKVSLLIFFKIVFLFLSLASQGCLGSATDWPESVPDPVKLMVLGLSEWNTAGVQAGHESTWPLLLPGILPSPLSFTVSQRWEAGQGPLQCV